MSVIQFPTGIHRFPKAGIGPAEIVILPVVRIERHGKVPANSGAQEELRNALGELNRANRRVSRSLKLHTYVPDGVGDG